MFADARQARQTAQALRALQTSESQITVLVPDEVQGDATRSVDGDLNTVTELDAILDTSDLSDGERRFYVGEFRTGRALLIVPTTRKSAAVRDLILEHGGYDVQSRGAELIHAAGSGIPGGTGPRPTDVTGRWEDVASRYEMLWQQHYGTSDATWEDMAPTYRFAWYLANEPRLRGRTWAEAEPVVRSEWDRTHVAQSWSDVAGPIRDVWDDVAVEARDPAEGGRARNVSRPTE